MGAGLSAGVFLEGVAGGGAVHFGSPKFWCLVYSQGNHSPWDTLRYTKKSFGIHPRYTKPFFGLHRIHKKNLLGYALDNGHQYLPTEEKY